MLPALKAGATALRTAFQCSSVWPVSMFVPPRNCNHGTNQSGFQCVFINLTQVHIILKQTESTLHVLNTVGRKEMCHSRKRVKPLALTQ